MTRRVDFNSPFFFFSARTILLDRGEIVLRSVEIVGVKAVADSSE